MKLTLFLLAAGIASAQCGEPFVSANSFFNTVDLIDGSLFFNGGADFIVIYGPSCDTSLYVIQPQQTIQEPIPPVIPTQPPPIVPVPPNEQDAGTPEPGTWFMTAFGLAILVGYEIRRSRR